MFIILILDAPTAGACDRLYTLNSLVQKQILHIA